MLIENQITPEDMKDKYDDIDECIRQNFDRRASYLVISHLLENGLNQFRNIDEINKVLKEINESDDEGHFMTKGFEEALIKTCYKIANNFEIDQVLEYVSRDLNFNYKEPISTCFEICNGKKTLKINAYSIKDLNIALESVLYPIMLDNEETRIADEDYYEEYVLHNVDDYEIFDSDNEKINDSADKNNKGKEL